MRLQQMCADTVRFNYFGDKDKGAELKGFASQGVDVLKNLMSYNKLEQGSITRRLSNGAVVNIRSCFGSVQVNTYFPEKGKEETPVTDFSNLPDETLVYMGPDNDLSAYTTEAIIQGVLRHWYTIPSTSLAELPSKLLLVIAAPKRALTVDEVAAISKFIAVPGRRLFISPSNEPQWVNEILVQLESKFELIPIVSPFTTTVRLAGLLPDSNLMALPCYESAWLAYKGDNPVVRDINTYGVWYDNVCSIAYLYYYSPPDAQTTYIFGPELNSKIPNSGSIIHWNVDACYPAYPYTYTDTYRDDYLNWYNPYLEAEIAPMTKAVAASYEFTRNTKGWRNFTDLGVCNFNGSLLAFDNVKNIIVAGFIPAWLTNSYDPSLFTSDLFCNWLIYGRLDVTDNFKQKYFMMPWPAMPSTYEWYWPSVIQT